MRASSLIKQTLSKLVYNTTSLAPDKRGEKLSSTTHLNVHPASLVCRGIKTYYSCNLTGRDGYMFVYLPCTTSSHTTIEPLLHAHISVDAEIAIGKEMYVLIQGKKLMKQKCGFCLFMSLTEVTSLYIIYDQQQRPLNPVGGQIVKEK